jgi:hypothetical protein
MDRPRHARRLCHLFKMTEGRCDGEDSRQYRMTKRTCGTCSLCCKLPYVRELNKSIDTWCKHASPGHGGCLIYPDRPASCRSFICGWLPGAGIGDEWFPARCKMFITSRPSEGPAKKGNPGNCRSGLPGRVAAQPISRAASSVGAYVRGNTGGTPIHWAKCRRH